jgi:hypothetical protein
VQATGKFAAAVGVGILPVTPKQKESLTARRKKPVATAELRADPRLSAQAASLRYVNVKVLGLLDVAGAEDSHT